MCTRLPLIQHMRMSALSLNTHPVVRETFPGFQWDNEDLYGYGRAFTKVPELAEEPLTILDPTAGGGSIPI